MTLRNFLKLHKEGSDTSYVSIYLLPYDYEKHNYTKTYFEETNQEEIEGSEIFKEIKNMQVHSFGIIGGGIYQVSLGIYLQEKKKNGSAFR